MILCCCHLVVDIVYRDAGQTNFSGFLNNSLWCTVLACNCVFLVMLFACVSAGCKSAYPSGIIKIGRRERRGLKYLRDVGPDTFNFFFFLKKKNTFLAISVEIDLYVFFNLWWLKHLHLSPSVSPCPYNTTQSHRLHKKNWATPPWHHPLVIGLLLK